MSRFENPSTFGTPLGLSLVPLQTVVLLVSVQVIWGGEFDAARQTNELLVLSRRTGGTSASRTRRRTAARLRRVVLRGPGEAVVLLVDQIIFVFAEHDVALLALGHALFDDHLGHHRRQRGQI